MPGFRTLAQESTETVVKKNSKRLRILQAFLSHFLMFVNNDREPWSVRVPLHISCGVVFYRTFMSTICAAVLLYDHSLDKFSTHKH